VGPRAGLDDVDGHYRDQKVCEYFWRNVISMSVGCMNGTLKARCNFSEPEKAPIQQQL
jgi:hypothetical protein